MFRAWLACALLCAAHGRLDADVDSLTVDCASDALTVRSPAQPRGSLYAVGFPRGCRAAANATRLRLPLSECGVRLTATDEGRVEAAVWLRVQSDAQLQQVGDPLRRVACLLPEQVEQPSRRGRAMSSGSATLLLDGVGSRGHVSVGETVKLTVRARLPRGIVGRVVDCAAHDGAGESAQPLIDSDGCAIDAALLPDLAYRAVRASRREEVVATARFPAFKFPDMRNLHVRCSLRLCAGACSRPDCAAAPEARTAQPPEVGRIALFNSIEVRAPGIDLQSDEVQARSAEIPPERTVCLSAGKVAAALAALGLVFLLAAAAALCIALGRRRERWPAPRFVRL